MKVNHSAIFPYAKACFEILENNAKALDQTIKQLMELHRASLEEKNILNFLTDPFIKKDSKIQLIQKLIPGLNQNSFLNKFIGLLAEKKKIELILDLGPVMEKLNDDSKNLTEVIVHSTHELSEKECSSLKSSLEKSLNKSVKIKNSIDKSLISGIVIQTEEYVIDNSVKGRLSKIKKLLSSSQS